MICTKLKPFFTNLKKKIVTELKKKTLVKTVKMFLLNSRRFYWGDDEYEQFDNADNPFILISLLYINVNDRILFEMEKFWKNMHILQQ